MGKEGERLVIVSFLAELSRFDNSQNVKMRVSRSFDAMLARHFHVSRILETLK
jgi:hypothetical protein